MITTTVRVDDKNVLRRLNSVSKKLQKVGLKSTKDVGRWTRDQLILRMPKESSDTAKSIGIVKEVHQKEQDQVVVGLRYIPYGSKNSPKSWKGKKTSNLFDFMMNSPMAVTGFYPYGNRGAGLVTFSKDVQKMRSVPLEAADKFRKRVIIETKKALK